MLSNPVIPQLNTSVVDPLLVLEKKFIADRCAIEAWFQEQWQLTRAPVYGSVDLRNAGFKLAPIDMNLFPAGFNNLNPDFLSISVKAAKNIIHQYVPGAKDILLVPESHTRNLFYWESIRVLQKVLHEAGFVVRLGRINGEDTESQTITLDDGYAITVEPLVRNGNLLVVDGFTPEVIVLNNDLSEGIPAILQNVQQPLIPPAELGWSQRLKSEHFQYYATVVDEFAAKFNIDPWLLAPLFKQRGQIDFMQQEGMECLIKDATELFEEIKQKYATYNIPFQPFLIIKADAGTYGMAVMTVRSIDELKSMNRKQRTRMATIKGGQPVNRVIVQEGVYTFETIGPEQAVAEPVVYLWGQDVVGGFYRVHQDRGVDENLNAPGMRFEPLAFPRPCHEPCKKSPSDPCQNRFYAYGVVARLSMLAAAREIKGMSA